MLSFANLLALLAIVTTFSGICLASEWKDLAPIPTGTLQEHSTVAISLTQLGVVGGLVQGGATTNNVLLYDISNNTWKAGAPLPMPLNHPNVAAVDGKIYVLGGLTEITQGNVYAWKAVPDAWVYDPTTDAWKALDAMSTSVARGGVAMGVYNRTIYVAGGIPGTSGRTVDTVSAFDVASGRWVSLPAAATKLPAPRDHVGGAVIGHKFYVVGGRDSGATNTRDTVFILDLNNVGSGWTTSEAKMPTPRGGMTAAAVGTMIYTFGGEGNTAQGSQGVFNQVEVYETDTDIWRSLPPMKLPRHGTSAVAVEGKIFIPGGGIVQGVGAVETFDVFTP